jgi:hypothetical protein
MKIIPLKKFPLIISISNTIIACFVGLASFFYKNVVFQTIIIENDFWTMFKVVVFVHCLTLIN